MMTVSVGDNAARPPTTSDYPALESVEHTFDTLREWLGCRGGGTGNGVASLGETSRSTTNPSPGRWSPPKADRKATEDGGQPPPKTKRKGRPVDADRRTMAPDGLDRDANETCAQAFEGSDD